jgi:hypothetical protein
LRHKGNPFQRSEILRIFSVAFGGAVNDIHLGPCELFALMNAGDQIRVLFGMQFSKAFLKDTLVIREVPENPPDDVLWFQAPTPFFRQLVKL